MIVFLVLQCYYCFIVILFMTYMNSCQKTGYFSMIFNALLKKNKYYQEKDVGTP